MYQDIDRLSDSELLRINKELKLKSELPHLFKYKFYKWQKLFIESRNKYNFTTAGNQQGKSLMQIVKCITWATEPSLWPRLWEHKPTQFWYWYPSLKLATLEFKEKWVKNVLPCGDMKNDPQYGWKEEVRNDIIQYIKFNSGITVYFFAYNQHVVDTQAASVDAMFVDEELPIDFLSEIQSRIRATNGYFHQVFTATLGQDVWAKTMEPKNPEEELFKDAFKQRVSLYDCMFYADGTPSRWTKDRIEHEKSLMIDKDEIDVRIYGRFKKITNKGNRMYPCYKKERHLVRPKIVDPSWGVYSGVDIGSGGKGHPAAIAFVAVNPQRNKGYVFRCWRGDNLTTTAGDVLNKYIELRQKANIIQQKYDFASKDFYTIAIRSGEFFEQADKNHERGELTLNTLFKYDMLEIFDTIDGEKLSKELENLYEVDGISVKKAKNNDLVDALRYAVTGISWDFSSYIDLRKEEEVIKHVNMDAREKMIYNKANGIKEEVSEYVDVISNEIEEANDFYGA